MSVNISEACARLFSLVPSNAARSNGHKLKHKKFCLKTRINFYNLRVTECWNSCPERSWSLLLLSHSETAWMCSCVISCRWSCLGREVWLDDLQRSIPAVIILSFCDFRNVLPYCRKALSFLSAAHYIHNLSLRLDTENKVFFYRSLDYESVSNVLQSSELL